MFTASLGVFIFGLLAAIAGGAVGAAIGGNYAFVMTGFMVLVSWGIFAATGNTFGFDFLAFGPFFGPYVAFAGGVAGAIYATYKGYMTDGKDVNSPLAGLGKPDVLMVGSLFGVFGYLVQIGISYIPWFGKHTDSVALTVLISGLAARWMFGGVKKQQLFTGSMHNPELFHEDASSFPAKIKPGPNGRWLEWQEKPSQLITIGSLFGIFAGAASIFLAANVGAYLTSRGLPNHLAAANANSFAFGISAIIILFLITNRNMPVQHHVTNIAGLAAVQFFPLLMGSTFASFKWTATSTWDSHTWLMVVVALIIAAVAGIVAAVLAELAARLWYNRGTSHIDPPAAAIWISNTLVVTLAAWMS
ncbi:hypothetical protein [Acidipropionibacterium jensenii]|uniref:DUF7973 domain-containing protein n=1 Tax=Acidipropionibacterium jensenii TaxID=1749 RepID=A0A3Q9ULN2_9ACTN|nr:hypothetical protein [Acidipropionibacterium jensenii]AZZ39892.1 hypothetical protein C0Z10_09150 [Acidipropionibacterium jensenii]MDN5976217.1 hypothetical protein [Acidipropionibacterium jensenii]MDN5995507.1 hypothetical protein [Acidipropionibacterium jensenii]MDN6426260.1 hypothetical protein [Acidipropionibacterium jensenii]MDN6441216.1 hypothetical protein [Acidipropionibacterium jensenii]